MIAHLLRQIINRTSFLHLATGNSLAIVVEVPRYLNDLQHDQRLLLLQTDDGKNELSKAEKDFAQFIDQTTRSLEKQKPSHKRTASAQTAL